MSMSDTMTTETIGDGMVIPKHYLSTDERTFQYQDTNPSLPVPELEQTLAKYLESVRPLVTLEEYQRTEAIVKAFQANVGSDLHRRLLQKASTKRNWLESWWEEFAYLRTREPHTPFVNFAGPGPYMNSYWPPQEGTQLERGALALWFALKYWQFLRQERLRVDRGTRRTVWCMNQVHNMYNGCKTPGHEVDKLNHYFKTELEGTCPTHLIVISNRRFYSINVVHTDGSLLTAPELQAQLKKIQENSMRCGPGVGLGYLTTENRTTWAKLHDHLTSLHPDNQCHLMAIQNSIMVLVLDDRMPATMQELTMEGLCGDASNRWFDKTLQLIIFKNGTITCNGDHAPHEAMVLIKLSIWMHTGCSQPWKGQRDVRRMPDPEELVFHLDPVIIQGVEQARQQYDITGSSVELHVDHYRGYGKTLIRKYKYHPDTFIQMAIQLAYYRMYNRPAPTYETASTRKFYHGRTETVRSCTTEVVTWVKSMLDPATKTKQKLVLLSAAMDKHLKLMHEAMENEGCDRHLFGLQMIAIEDGLPVPEIFTDPSWIKSGGSGNYVLSTSFVGFTQCFGGVAPMCKNGFGVFYSIVNDCVNLFISSWRADDTSSRRMYDNITQSLDDMKTLILSDTAKL